MHGEDGYSTQRAGGPRWLIILAGVLGIVSILAGVAIAGWKYINFVPLFRPPLPSMPEPNGYIKARAAVFPLRKADAGNIWPGGAPESLRPQIGSIRPILNKVRSALRLSWRLPASTDQDWSFRESAEFRVCARAFAAESRLARLDGDGSRAIHSSLDDLELGSKLAKGGGWIPYLVAEVCHSYGVSEAEHSAGMTPAAVIPDAIARIRSIQQHWAPFSEMLDIERATMLIGATTIFQHFQREDLGDKIDTARALQDRPTPLETIRFLLVPRRTALAHMDLYFRQQMAESARPVRQRRPVPTPDDPWSRALLPTSLFENPWKWERTSTDISLIEVALAVRMHYLEHGRYPTRLTEISKRWLPSIPVDLWEQPITYRLKNGQPVIYSMGPDGKDDGGTPANPNRVTAATRGDLVFGHLTRLHPRPDLPARSGANPTGKHGVS
jgi:hypothetical protein